nr:MAG TPA: hypothetical protein [Caudoviricetes sp.]
MSSDGNKELTTEKGREPERIKMQLFQGDPA